AEALSFKIQTEVVADHGRSRIPQLTEASVLSPLKALETYLTEVAPDKMERLLLRTQDMMSKLSDSKKAE
ncbi:MAG TPA: hypothetical protein PLY72_19540, partial [Candidatus Obscuribacter sp.]|nr:hypothetical protein [Candidatus Obscuribacter sp.]